MMKLIYESLSDSSDNDQEEDEKRNSEDIQRSFIWEWNWFNDSWNSSKLKSLKESDKMLVAMQGWEYQSKIWKNERVINMWKQY